MKRRIIVFTALCILIIVVFPLGLTVGGVDIPVGDILSTFSQSADAQTTDIHRFIIIENRLPALLAALLAGGALAVAGLLMQTCFNNPLAGPSIMGISGGASVGVAVVMMTVGSVLGFWGRLAVVGGATVGALIVLGVLLLFSLVIRSTDVLLIVGILLGYAASSAVSLLSFFSTDSGVHNFVVWGLGSFAGVGLDSMPLFAALCLALTLLSWPYAGSLNALLFGESFAENSGVNTKRVRTAVLLLSGGLTAIVTAWCGPIGFIGLVSPHIARMLLASSNHRALLPATALCGAATGLICQILSVSPALSSGATIPVNAITPVIGVPIIIYVLLRRKRLLYFN